MSTSWRLRTAAVVLAAATLGGLGAPPTAAAVPPTYLCSELVAQQPGRGAVYGRHLVGDLVADGPACRVVSSTVTGDVTVAAGTYLSLDRATVTGDVRRADGTSATWVEAWDSVMHGDVVVNALAVLVSTVHGDVDADATATPANPWRVWPYVDPVVVLSTSRLGGDVRVHGPVAELATSSVVGTVDATTTQFVRLRDTAVGADVTARGDARLVVHDTQVRGALHADRVRDVLVCRTGVGGDLVLEATRMWTRVGEEGRERCRTTVGGSVRVLDNPSSVILGDVHVTGDLVCANNTGSLGVVRRPGLTVAGTRAPECA